MKPHAHGVKMGVGATGDNFARSIIERLSGGEKGNAARVSGVERVKHIALDDKVNHGLPST
jgi:hypothetical protein